MQMTVTIRHGDCREVLRTLPDESVHCVVTSPPYWGLRDYGVAGQLGMEPSLGEHLQVMVEVFREVRRVLRTDGTCWVNYGDCYATTPNGRSAAATKAAGNDDRTFRDKPFSTIGPIFVHSPRDADRRGNNSTLQGAAPPNTPGRIEAGGVLKPKDLCMIPNRFAIALQDDGWWVRSEIIWHKPNPMPESVSDRPSGCHEKIWLLTKSERYAYDAEAVLQPVTGNTHARVAQDVAAQIGSARANGGKKTNGNMKAVVRSPKIQAAGSGVKNNSSFIDAVALTVLQRNLRNVWTVPTAAFSEAHFATFPPALIEPCIKAGCPVGGVVLDPFGGAGTTGLVADRLGRDAILIELNPEYSAMAERRISNDAGMFADVERAAE
jgi:DNA modification methylase